MLLCPWGPRLLVPVPLSQAEQTHEVHVVARWLVLKHKLLEIESLVSLSMGPTCTSTGTIESTGANPRGPRGRHVAGAKT